MAVRYAAMLCGVDSIACMLLDVLWGFEELKVCTRYRLPDGSTTDRFLPDSAQLEGVEPIYETLPGWDGPIDEEYDRSDLPDGARRYLDFIESTLGIPIGLISIGPERTQTLVADHLV